MAPAIAFTGVKRVPCALNIHGCFLLRLRFRRRREQKGGVRHSDQSRPGSPVFLGTRLIRGRGRHTRNRGVWRAGSPGLFG